MAVERRVTTLHGFVPELNAQLEALEGQDHVEDQQRAELRKGVAWTLAPGCLILVGGLFSILFLPLISCVAVPAAIVLVVIGMRRQRALSRLQRQDLDSDRIRMAQQLLTSLQPDLSVKKGVTLTLKHGDAVTFGVASAERAEGNLLTGKTYFTGHTDSWITVGGRLADGSVFRLSVTRVVKRKKKPKRKYTKITDRCRDKATLLVRLPAAVYPQLGDTLPYLRRDRLASHAGMVVTSCVIHNGNLRLTAMTNLHSKQKLRYSNTESGVRNQMDYPKLRSLLACAFSALSHHRATPTPGG